MKKYLCPCCGYLTLSSQGEYEICPVCFWEDDPTQSADENKVSGANEISLSQARANYLALDACEEAMFPCVRSPDPEEIP